MRPIKTANSNHNFGPPLGQEEYIGDLPCEIVDEPGQHREVVSVWEPSPAERLAILNGQNIRLGIGWVGAFPPVSIVVTDETRLKEDVAA